MPAPAHPHHLDLTLANGLRVSLRHAPRLKRCAAMLRVAAGSHDVPLAWPGLAHFLEHLLFLGTARFPTSEGLMAYVQRQGGQVNASTRERTTDFFFELPVPTFADGLERLADMLTHPRLTIEDQLREREVLQAEFVAWSQDAKAQQQVALLEGLAADHPLRGFHAGNRDSLPVEREAFQQALKEFHTRFYQSGQMTLNLAGPQPLEELQALAQRFSDELATGPQHPQAAPPALMLGHAQGFQYIADNHLHHVITCDAPRQALAFLCTWLNATAPGGLLAELKARKLANAMQATVLYAFAGQAVLDIDFALDTQDDSATQIEALLHDWLSFFAHSDWTPLREEFALLNARQQQTQSALAWVRNESEDLSEQGVVALKKLLDSLHLKPARQAWQLPPNNPFLRPPTKEQRAGLIRGQTSAHRGLRTFAQDRSRGRREVSALTFSQALADDTDEGALYLQWQFDNAAPVGLENTLQPLRENARQAGVELSFETIGNDFLVKMVGLHQPMPAVLDVLAQSLSLPQDAAPAATPMIAIRELLKALPVCCTDTHSGPASWATARWHGLGFGLPAACEAAIKIAAARLPGQAASIEHTPPTLDGRKLWHTIKTDSNEAALLLFCPAPTSALADEAAWRLLGHLLHGPFYQRLRVDLQIGYAVFSGIRQVNGQTGLLFGVQSPSVSLSGIVDHLQTFLKQLPSLIDSSPDLGNQTLAQQFSAQQLPLNQAAELLWQAYLAGHPSGYLDLLQQLIQNRTREDLQRAAQQLNDASGGWRCVANGPRINDAWQPAG
ncbi:MULTISPECIES: pyrroloquinoline quinone biosynthesis protein PqqF [unclassified Pseudomonas]|uniref:pyrroloquinoline quinone biosynthesis protein PqqF n=1 Tax=unclassified Pseudomonas TaxID=196821 RepID=UPI001F20BB47|nr:MULTISPECIES: pyrroloquinoline quinone biosynthesis protein PqqF [unclassified Pseudomonas]MCF5231141.1 pyrroloquinoline quinone biosynthesis protein PqqF [Pseudomonas sp. PA-5-4H]MCF5238973.1 pyrroloquinoline quinone biosynthesis protein PqqF [Pseudomonas sp. PA-5-4G]MCF5247448.1 pyrroloquinoline quinone biosynthesis protein PqqF [Pseudomonas sp. PA-5-4B]MCF5255839.1 pyrroloquinoline quinone biosynthesis protein PqqF [Pseudomonas sp. PA-5-4B]MCF5260874.1 pyrroloquinoline quinone biosynthes